MKVILSIKPEFANKIFEGSKRFEFRRSIFKNKEVKSVVVYASAPISKVIGEFDIDSVISKDLDSLWNETKDYSGIDKSFYDKYFSGKDSGYAIKVKKVKRYKEPFCLKEKFGLHPPQSFAYLA